MQPYCSHPWHNSPSRAKTLAHPCDELPAELRVRVELMNDDGSTLELVTAGETTDEAVERAEILAAELTGDPSYCMNDWSAA